MNSYSDREPLSFEAARLLRSVRDQRFNLGLRCVHCDSARIQLWGTFSGRQRYRCSACRRTFSDLTGTPMYRSKRIEAWPGYLRALQRCDSIRKSAQLLHVHPTTTFRWRHRFLTAVHRNANVALHGDVEVKEYRLPYSEKGSRALRRRPYARGVLGYGWISSPDRYDVLVQAVDRAGATRTCLTGSSRTPNVSDFAALLDPHCSQIHRIIATGRRYSPISLYCSLRGLDYLGAVRNWRRLAPAHHQAHLHNVTDSIARLKDWLVGFRGVATKYLPHYLAWRRFLDATEEELLETRWVASALPSPTPFANTA